MSFEAQLEQLLRHPDRPKYARSKWPTRALIIVLVVIALIVLALGRLAYNSSNQAQHAANLAQRNADGINTLSDTLHDANAQIVALGGKPVPTPSIGPTGPVGPPGPQGLAGLNGSNGSNGSNGKDGKDGKDGRNGLDGRDGVDGIDGINGINGKDGVDGKDGAPGSPGPTGPAGPSGSPGASGQPGYPPASFTITLDLGGNKVILLTCTPDTPPTAGSQPKYTCA